MLYVDNSIYHRQYSCKVYLHYIYIFEASLQWIFRFLRPFIASWIRKFSLTAAKLTCRCNTLRTSNSSARSDTSVVIDNEPHLSRTCKTSLLFAPLAVRVQAGCSAFPFYTPTEPFIIRLYFKYATVLIHKIKKKIFFLYFIYLS